MPFYEYECQNCKFYQELLQKVSDPPLVKCPSCGKNKMKKLISAPVFRLKGGGWYETDFKSDKENKRNLAVDKDSDSSSAEGSKASDSKPADTKAADSKTSDGKGSGSEVKGATTAAAPSESKGSGSGAAESSSRASKSASRSKARPAGKSKAKSKPAKKRR